MKISIKVDEDTGELTLTDEHGNLLDPKVERIVKRDHRDRIQDVMQKAADSINSESKTLTTLHTDTPPPDAREEEARQFDQPEPRRPALPKKSWAHCIWPPAEKRRQIECQRLERKYSEACQDWESARQAFEEQEHNRLEKRRQVEEGSLTAMEQALGEALSVLEWPYETLISYELRSREHLVLDVDLPEIEMLPARQASVPQRSLKISIKTLSQANQRQQYAQHIHAIGVRLIGECFNILPTIQTITFSGYSQRLDASSGHEKDDYLYSVKVDRNLWSDLNFQELEKIDPVECLGQFEIRRKMTKTGIFRPIEPLEL
ncbi:hypothetical protein NPJ88_006510 [Halomonas elongata]|uniref:hypothetical protein n=1 Tax=Halomonas elongata TaxID=2746 RepID=UPI00255A7B75|nr:hypothetical protein [Halomonas elongata]MDL4861978.1 hypothetical protein [Halomonas elongata]